MLTDPVGDSEEAKENRRKHVEQRTHVAKRLKGILEDIVQWFHYSFELNYVRFVPILPKLLINFLNDSAKHTLEWKFKKRDNEEF